MVMVRKVLILVLLGLGVATVAPAQKELRKIRTALKDSKYDEAVKLIEQCAADSNLRDDPKVYEYGIDVQRRINNEENEKIYLKQSYDTARFFSSVKGIFDYALKCDEKEVLQGKPKSRGKNQSLLLDYYPNLGAACRYFYMKHNYEGALPYLQLYIEAASAPLLAGSGWAGRDPMMPYMGYLYLKCSYKARRYDDVTRYVGLALRDSLHAGSTYHYLALTSQEQGRRGDYLRNLRSGLAVAPGAPYFFTSLTDYYIREDSLERALSLADSLLATKPESPLFLFGKSLVLMSMKRYSESIEVAKAALEHDKMLAEAYYNIGACYCNLAAEMVRPDHMDVQLYQKTHEQVKAYYTRARPYLEQFRSMQPGASERWAPLLYRVYLNLNMGPQFEEMDRIVRSLPKEALTK